MLVKYYVAHIVVLRRKLIKYGFNYDLIGCHFNNYYFISKKAILLRRDNDGNYLNSNSTSVYKVIDPNDLVSYSMPLECNTCIMKSNSNLDCESMKEVQDEVIGVVGVRPIASFDKNASWTDSFNLVKAYNNKVQEDIECGYQDEFEYVDDIRYPDLMREIDESIKKMLHSENNNMTDDTNILKRVKNLDNS